MRFLASWSSSCAASSASCAASRFVGAIDSTRHTSLTIKHVVTYLLSMKSFPNKYTVPGAFGCSVASNQ